MTTTEKEIVELPVGRKTKQALPLETTVFKGKHCEEKKVFHTDKTIWFVVGVSNDGTDYPLYSPETHAFDTAPREQLIVQRFNSDVTAFSVLKLVEAYRAGYDAEHTE